MKMKKYVLSFLLLFGALFSFGQPQVKFVKVIVTPNSSNWNYKIGEKVKFDVRVTQNNINVENAKVRYELSYDMMPSFEKKDITLQNGTATINAGTMTKSGFLRCIVYALCEGKEYSGLATAGFEPELIKPTAICPNDFLEFWNNAKTENAKIPIDPKLTLIPDRCTEKVNVYQVSIQNYSIGSRIYGILSVPKVPGKYPAFLQVPGAGVRPYNGEIQRAESGIITLEIGIHGIPVTMNNQIYDDLKNGALKDYYLSNWDNRDKVYYKRVYLGCVRAVDYIFSMKEFDGSNIVVQGGSQGGALAIITAGLDNRITGLVSYYPALSDLTGYIFNRAGGWPHLFNKITDSKSLLEEKIKVSGYYDVVNFARQIKVPGFYSFGYNDMVCPPTSVFSSINSINAPKTIFIMPETEHWSYPEQSNKSNDWIISLLKK